MCIRDSIVTMYNGSVNTGTGTVACGLLSNTTINTNAITTNYIHVKTLASIDSTLTSVAYQTESGQLSINADGSMSNTSISSTGSITANQFTTNNNGPINTGNGQVSCGNISSSGIVQASGYIMGTTLLTSNNGNLNVGGGTVICGKVQCTGEVATSILTMSNLVCTTLTSGSIALKTPIITGFPYSMIMTCTPETAPLTPSASAPVYTFYTTGAWSLTKIRASLTTPGSQSITTIDVNVGGSSVIASTNNMTISAGSAVSTEVTSFNANALTITDNTQIQIFCTAADSSAQGLKVTFFYTM